VRDVLPQLSVGRWLSPKDPLAQVVEEGARLRGYLEEAELWRVAPGATGRFIADDPMRASGGVDRYRCQWRGLSGSGSPDL
jgi:putative peptide zinc metalloprotease protein